MHTAKGNMKSKKKTLNRPAENEKDGKRKGRVKDL